MASKSLISFLILFPLFYSSISHAADDTPQSLTTPQSPETICNSTPFPSSCISILPKTKANVYDFGRFSVQQSISQSQKFLNLIQKQLQRSSTFSLSTFRALQDCQYLASVNLDFLSTCNVTLSRNSKVLPSLDAEDVQTLLSSILTNLQTCQEGLQSAASLTGSVVENEVSDSISNDSKLHSVSLALFTNGWVPKRRDASALQPKAHPTFRSGRLPLLMSSQDRKIYDAALNRRRLLQTGNNSSVVVKDIVVVRKDGTGNFTTINDAIAAAPNNSVASSGYFLIYVTEGEYQEYVSIPSNKKYLFLLGDGIGKTIITGNRSVGDNSTTFNSATFGKYRVREMHTKVQLYVL